MIRIILKTNRKKENMRYHSLRYDIWLCLFLGLLVSIGIEKLATPYLTKKYEQHKEEHKVDKNQVGGIADESIFRAQTIDDILSHDTFTVVSKGIQYKNKGAGYYKNMYLYALTLPSGEIVAARINGDSVVNEGDSIYTGNSILPVGRVIKEDLREDSYFLSQIQYDFKLDRIDFYVDMVGNAAIESPETFIETPIILLQILIVVLFFPIFHTQKRKKIKIRGLVISGSFMGNISRIYTGSFNRNRYKQKNKQMDSLPHLICNINNIYNPRFRNHLSYN